MTLLNVAALGLLGLAVPLVLLYLLKMRRYEKTVSSTVLWQKVINDLQATSPFQKLRKNLLLLLQLIILGLLVLALARPTIVTSLIEDRSIVLILDLSASMKAVERDGRPRFEAARARALEIVDNLGAAKKPGKMMVITIGRRTQVRSGFTTEAASLRRTIEALRPGDTGADAAEALALASAKVKDEPNPEIVLISDGAGIRTGDAPVAGRFTFVRVGETAENLAITRLDVRPASPQALAELKAQGKLADGRYPYQVFAAVRNEGTRARKSVVSLQFEGRLTGAREVELGAGTETTLVFKERFPPGLLEVRIEEPDALPADNAARAMVRPADEVRVALFGARNAFVERVFEALPYVDVSRPASLADGSWDLVVCDRRVPDPLPDTNLLLLAPDRDLPGYARGGVLEFPEFMDWQRDHPLFRAVEFNDVHVSKAQALKGEVKGRVLARSTDGAPLLLLQQTAGRSFQATLTFSVVDSDWPLRPSFLIFFQNLLQYARDFNTLGTVPHHRTGTVVALPPLGEAEVAAPSGAKTKAKDAFAETDEAGLYTASWGEERAMRFAVNLLDERESAIAPAKEIHVGSKAVAGTPRLRDVNREIWPWVAAGVLALALLEWWAYHWKVGH